MIQSKTKKVWLASDGSEHSTMENAQVHDIEAFLNERPLENGTCSPTHDSAVHIVTNASDVLDILITDGRKRKRISKAAKKTGKKASEKPETQSQPIKEGMPHL